MGIALRCKRNLHFQCNNQKLGRYAHRKVSSWNWNGCGPPCSFSLCDRGTKVSIFSHMDYIVVFLGFQYRGYFSLYLICPSLYNQVSPAFVRGTYGSFIQLATCLGLMGALFIGIPVKAIIGW